MRQGLRARARIGAWLAVAVLSGCARAEMPPGHSPDFEPPVVVEMFPSYGAVVPDFDDDVFLRFDEPLGDPRSIERLLVTSPAWQYVVSAGRSNARIRPRDGWRRGVVYQFTIPPGVRDMIRNQTREPIEFLFTTGDSLTATSTSGRVLDRVTVRPVRDVRVLVIGADSVPYSAVTDTGGNFALASLPIGDYWAFAFRDQNRNLSLDRDFEAHDSSRVELVDVRSAVEMEMWLVPPDSTPPVLLTAEAFDSLRVSLSFDELLEPDFPLDSASVEVRRVETDEMWPVESFMIGMPAPALPEDPEEVPDGEAGPETGEEPPAAEEAGLEAPEVGPEETPPAPDQVEESPDAAPPDAVEEVRAQPEALVSVILARPLEAATYEVRASGFANLRLLTGGGDTTFVYEPPPEPEPAVEDTVPAAPDSVPGVETQPAVPPDSAGAGEGRTGRGDATP